MTALAAGTGNLLSLVLLLIFVLVMSGLLAAALTVTVIRINRASQPPEQQLARLAARLDGRSKVTIRKVEFSVGKADLLWVARSRGYSMIERWFGADSYYEFVYTPHRPGGYA